MNYGQHQCYHRGRRRKMVVSEYCWGGLVLMCYSEMTASSEAINARGVEAWPVCLWVQFWSCSGEPLLLEVERRRPIRTCRIFDLLRFGKCRTICLFEYQLCHSQPHEGALGREPLFGLSFTTRKRCAGRRGLQSQSQCHIPSANKPASFCRPGRRVNMPRRPPLLLLFAARDIVDASVLGVIEAMEH
jgi:hypothetical protein